MGYIGVYMERELPDDLEAELKEAGENLRASHDDAIIADVIGKVEQLEKDRAAETADLLRFMVEDSDEDQ